MIKLENVSKTFESYKALDNLSLTVPKGSIYGLMGLNGAGKTTVIKHIAGFLKADSGEITVDGEPILDNENLKQRLIIIPDEIFFFRGYSLTDMASYFSKIYKNWSQPIFDEMLRSFQLKPNQNLGKFSKGMRKQAAFILAMSAQPDYLILDEPIDGLDPIIRLKLRHYLMEAVADRKMTVLISSHNAKEMEDICDYLGILANGKLAFEGSLLSLEGATVESIFIEKLGGGLNV